MQGTQGGLDFDDGIDDGPRFDMSYTGTLLTGANTGRIYLLPAGTAGTYLTCKASPWTDQIEATKLVVGAEVCSLTSQGRVGRLKVSQAPSGPLGKFVFTYICWKKAGDT